MQNGANSTTRAVFLMSVPIFVELLLQLLVGNIDQFMVSRVSQEAVAAIGNGNQVMNLTIIVINVLCMASSILVSREIGAKDGRSLAQICTVSVAFIGAVSLAVTLMLVFGSGLFFRLLRVPEDILGQANDYLMIVGAFALVQGLYMVFAAMLRAYGFVREVMLTAVIMNALNIAGNAVLIGGLFGLPRLGIVGAAISTDISKTVGLLLLFCIFRKKTGVRMRLSHLRPFPRRLLGRLVGIGLPTAGQELSYSLSQMVILSFINPLGPLVIATKVYCSTLANCAYVYSMAIAQATQIVIGYMVGAGRIERIERRIFSTIGVSAAVSMSLTAVFFVFSDSILGIFTQEPEILALGRQILFIEFFLELGRSFNITMTRCLTSIGDVRVPVYIALGGTWLVAVCLGYALGIGLGLGLAGIWIAMAADEIVRAAVYSLRLRMGAWRSRLYLSGALEVEET